MGLDDRRIDFELPIGETYFNAAQIGPTPRVPAEAGAALLRASPGDAALMPAGSSARASAMALR